MNKVLILDFGSQYTQLIARRIREKNVYCEIRPCTANWEDILEFKPKAVVLSGGPASVLKRGAPLIAKGVFELGVPVLGICYGMQVMARLLGGKVVSAKSREYGPERLKLLQPDRLLDGVRDGSVAWMSHGDSIADLPEGFEKLAESESGVPAAIAFPARGLYALQFHPEVHHTEFGNVILENFLFRVAALRPDWNMKDFIAAELVRIRETVGDGKVVLGVSGGVDSSVAASLIHRAIGKRLNCVFINNGLLRHGEAERVKALFRNHLGIPLRYVDAGREFLRALRGVADPERKRKIIGRVFVRVFEREARRIKGVGFLAQGTLYPDVIESVSFKGPSAVIKSHHNVGGLPKKMGLKILEPLRELFKDEVRELGRRLGVPEELLRRHPFPGPGLAVRVIGALTPERLALAGAANRVVMEEIKREGLYDKVWQAFAVLLPVRSVGVMGDERTYENACAVRVVDSVDGMTAHWADLPRSLLERISGRIIREVRGINRVVYDISSKPPATIEWE